MKKGCIIAALAAGMIGCLCFGGGDWLMIYGDMTSSGSPYWLTAGAAEIPAWRNSLAMAIAFPGIIGYGAALFFMEGFVKHQQDKKIYHYLNAFGLTPWLALHLFYVMILFLFQWLNNNGFAESALEICGALYEQLAWIVPLSEAFMLPVFVWWFVLQIRGRTIFPKGLAFTNVLVIYGALYGVKSLLPVSAFKIGFTNGLMSESMAIFFVINFLAALHYNEKAH